jgi:hypothetical protein
MIQKHQQSASSPPHRPAILRHQGIVRKHNDPLNKRFGDQDVIERVLVDRGQIRDGEGMLARDDQFAIVVVEKPSA